VEPNRHGAGALAEDRYLLKIAPEVADVVTDPMKGELLVHETIVAVEAMDAGKEAKDAQPVIERDHDDVFRG